MNSLRERNLALLRQFPLKVYVDDLFSDVPASGDGTIFSMNTQQAKELKSNSELIAFVASLLTHGDEEKALTALYEVFQYWEDRGDGPDVPGVLLHFLTGDTSALPRQIDLNEVQAVLGFKKDQELWAACLALGGGEASAYTLLTPTVKAEWQAKFRALYGNQLRRIGQLAEAREIITVQLESLQAIADPNIETHRRISFLLYEIGYISFLLGDRESCLAMLEKSAASAVAGNDLVGEHISLTAEYRFRYLWSLCGSGECYNVISHALRVFEENSEEGRLKYGHARRWVLNCYLHQLDIAHDLKDSQMAERAIAGVRKYKSRAPDEKIILLYEGIYNLAISKEEKAAELLIQCLELQKATQAKSRFVSLEEKSRIPYLLGLSYARSGRLEDAAMHFKAGAQLDSVPGNHTWKERAKAAVRMLTYVRAASL